MRRYLPIILLLPALCFAADSEYTLTIRDHVFTPAELRVPAGRKIRLVIDNQDASPEEFESHELNREKVIPGKSRLPVFIGPLKPGRYAYVGEFNEKTARGVIVAE